MLAVLTAAVAELESQMGAVILFNGQRHFDHFVPNGRVHVVKDHGLMICNWVDVRCAVQAVL